RVRGHSTCSFTMTSCTHSVNHAPLGGGCVYSSGEFTMSGGTISGNTVHTPIGDRNLYGGGVYVGSSGKFTMIGGEISGNKAYEGGGVFVINAGTFIMTDGTISENTASPDYGGFGGGVCVMYDTEISSALDPATFTMNGGTISGNKAGDGGGVAVYLGEFTMNGGTISGNTATESGGGVVIVGDDDLPSTFTMESGTFSGNEAPDGGGVCVLNFGEDTASCTFSMENGTISGNSASYGGGAYVDYGTFTMSGGAISGNTASTNGGGVYVGGAMNVSDSPVVSGNTADNVYLPSGKYITLASALETGASIGVTTEDTPTVNNAVEITTAEGSTAYYSASLSSFSSDNTAYTVRSNATEKYLELFLVTPLTEANFTVDTTTETYNGSAFAKTITSDLIEGTDYTVSYSENVAAGTATITITGIGGYTGTLTYEFAIVKAAQDISYETTSVTKTEGDDAFTNPLTQTTVGGAITYTSSDESVATVDANGKVTIVGAGTATITATAAATDNYTEATASYTLTVEAAAEEAQAAEEEAEAAEEEAEAAEEAEEAAEEDEEVVDDDDSDDGSSSSGSSTTSGSSGSSSSSSSSSTTTSPKTGDESKVVLWLTLVITAAFGLFAAAIYSRKKNEEQ
ncbi:MAG: Ig-like domain-containing protein, partial [Clostridiales bacterium]|nr:Ig-like domain-containing protein [Clostridiales bacterium]